MATKKKAVKPAAKKPAPKKAAPKPVKKVAPAKKQAKPAPKKQAKPATKKPVVKAKKPVKAAPKPVAKKQVAAKAKVAAKTTPPKHAKPLAKPLIKMPIALKKHAEKPMTKKTEIKPVAAKPAATKIVATKPLPAKPVAAAKPASPKATAKNVKDIKVMPPKPVVIPKFNTKTSRKYQPDFTKSVLDQPKNDPGAPIVRYSDAELMEFRELIHRKLEAAKKELTYLQGLITRKDEMGGDESDNRYMTMEDGSLSMEREQLSQMASRQITFIDHLEKAIMRIENKTYGICRVTGKLIDKARLRAVPHATLSIEAKMGTVR